MTVNSGKITANWKSTALGFCIFAMAAMHAVHFDAAGHLAMTAKDWFGVTTGALASLIGVLMKDAGTTTAINSAGDIEDVASHEIPDDPANQPVAKQ
jgi:hypothetical protein